MSIDDKKPGGNVGILENEVSKIIKNEEKTLRDDFFTQKFNLTLSKESSIGLKKSTDLLDDMKRNDKLKLKQYNEITEELPRHKELSKFDNIMGAGSAPRLREMFGQIAPVKHYDMYIKHEGKRRSYKTFNKKFGRTFAHFTHGRMGVDTFFVIFGVLGAGLLTYYQTKKVNSRRKHVQSHGISGERIENQHEDDPDIDLDDVSIHSSFYDMSNIREEARIKRLKEETKNQLIKEVYTTKNSNKMEILERQLLNKLNKISIDKPEVNKD